MAVVAMRWGAILIGSGALNGVLIRAYDPWGGAAATLLDCLAVRR